MIMFADQIKILCERAQQVHTFKAICQNQQPEEGELSLEKKTKYVCTMAEATKKE